MVVESQTKDPFEGDTVDRHLHVSQYVCLILSTLCRFSCHNRLKEWAEIYQFLERCFIKSKLDFIGEAVSKAVILLSLS